jgi:hypothetical protein
VPPRMMNGAGGSRMKISWLINELWTRFAAHTWHQNDFGRAWGSLGCLY